MKIAKSIEEITKEMHDVLNSKNASKSVVETALNTMDYSENRDYIPSDFALEFVNFIKLVNGEEGEENLTPVVHYRMLDTIAGGDRNIANLCHRGIAKTTLMAEYLFLYLAVYGELPHFGVVDLALYVSDSIENGVKNMRKNLEYRWNNSDFLQQYVPIARFTDIRYEFTNIDGKTFIVKGYGAKTGVRGAKEMGTRPKLAVLDDLISDEDARSDTVISAVEDTVNKAVNYALHPKRKMRIWSGTPFNAKDPLYKAVESGAWTVNVFPVCEVFPVSEDHFRSSWPDRFDYRYVKQEYDDALAQGAINTFNQELMLRIMSEEDRLIPDNALRWYESSLIQRNKSRFNFYITTDFATSEKERADYSFISVWALNNQGDWFWVDGICKRQTMDKNMDDLFKFVQKYQPQEVGIEISGQQHGFIAWMEREMMLRNIYFNIGRDKTSGEAGFRPNTNKLTRFNIMVPLFKAGKMYFPYDLLHTEPMLELMDELKLASVGGFKSKHDDGLDTVSMLASLNIWRPSGEATLRESRSKYWELDEDEDEESDMDSYVT